MREITLRSAVANLLSASFTVVACVAASTVLASWFKSLGTGDIESMALAFLIIAIIGVPFHFIVTVKASKKLLRVTDAEVEDISVSNSKNLSTDESVEGKQSLTRFFLKELVPITLTIVFLVFFTIPSVPVWERVANLDQLEAGVTKRQTVLAQAQNHLVIAQREYNELLKYGTAGPGHGTGLQKKKTEIQDLKTTIETIKEDLRRDRNEIDGVRAKIGAKSDQTILEELGVYFVILADLLGIVFFLKVLADVVAFCTWRRSEGNET